MYLILCVWVHLGKYKIILTLCVTIEWYAYFRLIYYFNIIYPLYEMHLNQIWCAISKSYVSTFISININTHTVPFTGNWLAIWNLDLYSQFKTPDTKTWNKVMQPASISAKCFKMRPYRSARLFMNESIRILESVHTVLGGLTRVVSISKNL